MSSVRVILPYHLRNLAQVGQEITVQVDGAVTIGSILDAIELAYPVIRGTIREHGTLKRRPFLRFFACAEDVSMEGYDFVLPSEIGDGKEPFMVIGAIAGG